MPPTLGRAFPPSWDGYPPHMSPKDYTLWQPYRRDHLPTATALYFDVALGRGEIPDAPALPPIEAMWSRVTSFRADCIIDSPRSWTLVELRDNAGAGALGAVLLYADLWAADPPDARPITLELVTNHLHPDLARTLRRYGIRLTIVKP